MQKLNKIKGESGKKEISLFVLALIAIPGLLILEFFPRFTSSLYEGHVEKLLYANYSLCYVFYAFVFSTLAFLTIRSISREARPISSKKSESGEKN